MSVTPNISPNHPPLTRMRERKRVFVCCCPDRPPNPKPRCADQGRSVPVDSDLLAVSTREARFGRGVWIGRPLHTHTQTDRERHRQRQREIKERLDLSPPRSDRGPWKQCPHVVPTLALIDTRVLITERRSQGLCVIGDLALQDKERDGPHHTAIRLSLAVCLSLWSDGWRR